MPTDTAARSGHAAEPARQIQPPPPHAAGCIHYVQIEAAGSGIHQLPASPFPIAVAVLSGRIAFDDGVGGWTPMPELFVGGPFLRPLRYRAQAGAAFAAALLSPGRMHCLLGIAQTQLTDTFWPFEAFAPRQRVEVLLDALRRETCPARLAERLCTGVLTLVTAPRKIGRRTAGLARLHDEQGGPHRGGRRQFERRFAAAYGMSLRRARKLARFTRALAAVTDANGANLARIAQDCGYFDQPQMTREFVELAGLAPSRLARTREDAGMGIFHYSTLERRIIASRERAEPLLGAALALPGRG